MKPRYIRIAVSGLIFVLFVASFILNGQIADNMESLIASFQFIPSLIRLFRLDYLAFASVVIIAVTILAGRVYCSSICPLGTLQDCIGAVPLKRKTGFARRSILARYAIPLAAIAFFVFGINLFLDIVDPYSAAYRIADNLIRMAGLRPYGFSLPGAVVSAAFLLVLIIFVLLGKREYCNSVCPAGAILSLFSRFSLCSVNINKNLCVSCRKCEQVCKAGCIDSASRRIDSSRCISCFNCISACRLKAIYFGRKNRCIQQKQQSTSTPAENFSGAAMKKTKQAPPQSCDAAGLTRRNFISLASIAFVSWPLSKLFSRASSRTAGPVTPPGSIGVEHFTANCTACNLCVAQCPTKVLRPSFLEYGIDGILQPRLDYNYGNCRYDCNICSQICPTHAIIPLAIPDKKKTSIGTAEIDKSLCIPYAKGTSCAACDEMCPTGATKLSPYTDKVNAPKVDVSKCIGCGACQYACPVSPKKAITVTARSNHVMIKDLPVVKTVNDKKDSDFAF